MNRISGCNPKLLLGAAVAACAFAYGCLPSQAADLGTDYHRPGVRHVRTTLYFSNWRDRCALRASTVSMPGTATSIIILGTIVHPRMRSRVGIIVDIFTRHSTAAAAPSSDL